MKINFTKTLLTTLILTFAVTACHSSDDEETAVYPYPTIGSIEIIDSVMCEELFDSDSKMEVLSTGFAFAEGPVWVESHSMLLFSDIPNNAVYKWTESGGTVLYLKPSGYMGSDFTGPQPGSNGLIINKDGKLTLAQHGDHQLAYMDAPLDKPEPKFVTLASKYQGKRLNSPNDVVQDSEGNYYFTDPIFGLEKPEDQVLPFQGVYKVSTDGTLTLLIDSLSSPNGLVLTNDEKHLLVGNSSRTKAYLYEFELSSDRNSVTKGRIVYDFTPETKVDQDALDGFKMDKKGNIFTTGPGGLWILNKEYKPIARLRVPDVAIGNCWLTNDNKTLYLTATDKLLRLKLK